MNSEERSLRRVKSTELESSAGSLRAISRYSRGKMRGRVEMSEAISIRERGDKGGSRRKSNHRISL